MISRGKGRDMHESSNISVYDPNRSNPQKRLASNTQVSPADWGLKRSKQTMDGEGTAPSRVLFIRNLPFDVTEMEVASLAIPFGALTNMVLTKSGGFCLIELSKQSAAEDMVNFYDRIYSPTIRGAGPIVVTFSRYLSLNVDVPNQQINEAIHQANKEYAANAEQDLEAGPRKVVRVQVYQAPTGVHFRYLQFYRLFTKFGRILRIVTFKSGAVPNALIEFDNPYSACVAIMQTDGVSFGLEDMPYPAKCMLRADFSRQNTIDVYSEDENCRDFTRNPLPGQKRTEPPSFVPSKQNGTKSKGSAVGVKGTLSTREILEQLTEDRLAQLESNTLSELASRMVKPLLKAALEVGGEQSTFLKSQAEVLDNLAPRAPSGNNLSYSGGGRIGGANVGVGSTAQDNTNRSIPSPVVCVSNLDEERVTPDILFILFGVYGDVQRVKILHDKKDSALIQFADNNQAQLAIKFLDGAPLFGKPIYCSFSRDTVVTGSDDAQTNDAGAKQLYREYIGHRLHRFRWATPRDVQNLCAPTKVLSVSNLPERVSEEDITDAFARTCDCQIVKIKLMRSAKPLALVEMGDVGNAISALIAMHDFELDTNARMRVGFTKSIIRS